jgi:hypothetical protein
MPRQPYFRVSPNTPGTNLAVGTSILGSRPKLELLIGQCVMAWPPIETEMALILAHLIGAKDSAALAVFHHLRRSSSQREAIMEAAQVVLDAATLELLTAFLNVHKSIETQRNALAHGYFGTTDDLPDDLLWLSTNDYAALKTTITLKGAVSSLNPESKDLMNKFFVYRDSDLQSVLDDIRWMGGRWYQLLDYLRRKDGELYRRLCDQPRIAQELVKLRQKNNSSVPTHFNATS